MYYAACHALGLRHGTPPPRQPLLSGSGAGSAPLEAGSPYVGQPRGRSRALIMTAEITLQGND